MSYFGAALWAELLKARRSMMSIMTALGVTALPLAAGLFMVILKDPVAARDMGLISTKAQIVAGSADWPAFVGILLQGTAAAGSVIFALITAWVFGSEFSDRTSTELLALPTPRHVIVVAKFLLLGIWIGALGLLIYLEARGWHLVRIPGWSPTMVASAGHPVGGHAAHSCSCLLWPCWRVPDGYWHGMGVLHAGARTDRSRAWLGRLGSVVDSSFAEWGCRAEGPFWECTATW
jgi:hypothetical protein